MISILVLLWFSYGLYSYDTATVLAETRLTGTRPVQPGEASPALTLPIPNPCSKDLNVLQLYINCFVIHTGAPCTSKLASNKYFASLYSQLFENRARIPSHYMREMTRGRFMIKHKDITLLETIGEGVYQFQLWYIKFTSLLLQESLA